jgi:hypothetical protein
MAKQTVYIQVATGEPRREWCDRCLTSAFLVVDLYALMGDGPHRIGTWGACTRCDEDEWE